MITTVALFTVLLSFGQNTLSVSGTASKKLSADVLTIQTGIQLQGEKADELFAESREIMNQALKYLKGKEKILQYQTDIIRLNTRVDYRSKTTMYNSYQVLTIRLKDFTKYDEIMNELIQLGFNNIQHVQFELSSPESVKEEVRRKAIEAAKLKASETASLLDVNLGKVAKFSENMPTQVYPNQRVANYMKDGVEVGGESSTLAPAQVTFTVTVYVEYHID